MRRCGRRLARVRRDGDDRADQLTGLLRTDLIAPGLLDEDVEAGGPVFRDGVGQSERRDDDVVPLRARDREADLAAGGDADGLRRARVVDAGVDDAGLDLDLGRFRITAVRATGTVIRTAGRVTGSAALAV